jgi:hypothetical protein
MKVKNSIKKVGAVAGSALMVGLTMGSAAMLSDYPQPFVDDDGNVASQIVVGSQGKVADVVGAVNVAASLGQSTVQTETQTISAEGTPGWNANSGATLDTVNERLFYGQSLDSVRSTVTSDELGVLESESVTDSSGTTYNYDHYVYVGDATADFNNEPSDTDPQMMADTGKMSTGSNPSSNYWYQSSVVFQDALNNDTAGEELSLFGKTFSVSSDKSEVSPSEIVLYGGGDDTTLEVGDSTTVTVDGQDFDVTLNGITNNDKADLTINGNNYVKDSGTSLTVSDTSVFVDSVKVYTIPENTGSVTLSFGSEKLTLNDQSKVMTGSDDDKMDGTWADLQGDGNGQVSTLDVYVGPQNSDNSHLAAGESMEDPVFGTFSMAFGGLNPDTTAGQGEEISFSTSGDADATASFTTTGGDDANINFAHNESGALNLEDSNDNSIVTVENATVGSDEYTALEAGGFRHMVQFTQFGDVDSSEADVTFEDVNTGTSYTVSVPDGGATDKIIDGKTYTFYDADLASNSDVGNVTVDDNEAGLDIWNGLETMNGGMLHFTDVDASATVSAGNNANATSQLELPTGTLTEGDLSMDWSDNSNDATETVTKGQVQYEVDETSDDGSTSDVQVSVTDQGSTELSNPAALFVEEENDNDNQHAFVATTAYDGGGSELDVAGQSAGVHHTDSSWSGFISLDSNSDRSEAVDTWGTHFIQTTSEQGGLTFHYPNNQASVGAAFYGEGGSLAAGGGGETVEYEAVSGMGTLRDMGMLDSEVTESVRSNEHLILVGGPAVNSLVQTLSDEGSVDLSDVANAQSGAVIQGVSDAFASGQHALVVAGYSASDTRSAAEYLSNYGDHEQAMADAGERLMLTQADYPSDQ